MTGIFCNTNYEIKGKLICNLPVKHNGRLFINSNGKIQRFAFGYIFTAMTGLKMLDRFGFNLS